MEKLIFQKLSDKPYYATYQNIPFTNNTIYSYYQGHYLSSEPIIAKREAGWNPIQPHQLTQLNNNIIRDTPNVCFQIPCSTVIKKYCC